MKLRFYERGQAPIVIAAGVAGAVLLVTTGWWLSERYPHTTTPLTFERPSTQEVLALRPKIESQRNWKEELELLGLINTSTEEGGVASSTLSVADMISQEFLNGYSYLKESGRYTKETAAEIGQSIGENVRAPSQFVMHGEAELKKDSNVSKERSLQYRSDMREALSVLITDTPPEFELFGLYIETRNPERLRELGDAASRYQQAEHALLTIVVPQDASALHLRAINALGSYADAINQLIQHADDALSTLAILRTYNDAERELLYAFDALASYYVRKSAEN